MLIQKLISTEKYNIKCPYTLDPIGICIHNTANDASAANEISYMQSNNNEVSFHVAVDDKESIQGLPLNRNAWAAGDGNGQGNRKYIHVEICYSKSGGAKFEAAEKRAAKEVAALLKSYGWGIDRVKDHRFFSGKNCPHRTDMNKFRSMVNDELIGDVPIKTPDICDREIRRYRESGKCTITTKDGIIFRDKPCTCHGTRQGVYGHNESVYYDLVVLTEKYVWISWISLSTGTRRYMPIVDKKRNSRWGVCI